MTYLSKMRKKSPGKRHAYRAKAAVSFRFYSWHTNSLDMKISLKKFRIVLKKE